jgi:hypothetical protein
MPTASRSMLRTGRVVALATVLVLLSVLPGASAPMPTAWAWIDQPLPGSVHPLAPLVVTAHATDPLGVAVIELWVADELVEAAPVDEPAPILAMHEFTWTPEAAGAYLITVRGLGAGRAAGQPASAIITVGDPEAASPSPSPIPSPSGPAAPSATPPPTPSPCTPPPPDLIAPANGVVLRDPSLNPPVFEWLHRTPPTCPPTGYRIQLFDDPALTSLVEDVALGLVNQWRPRGPLADCTTYYWRVASTGAGGALGAFSNPWSVELFVGRC